MIRRPPRSTHCISSAASDVYKRQDINKTVMERVPHIKHNVKHRRHSTISNYHLHTTTQKLHYLLHEDNTELITPDWINQLENSHSIELSECIEELKTDDIALIENSRPIYEKGAGKYELEERIGRGAYAVVRKGVSAATNKVVAVKVYERFMCLEPRKRKRMLQEVNILKRVHHANIVKYLDSYYTSDCLCLVMEMVEGKSLREYINSKPRKRIYEWEALGILKQIVQAVNYCHLNNIYHRDIKLDDILIDKTGKIMLIDFGFACSTSGKLKNHCGTLFYMAPEIVGKKEYSGGPGDMWAVGVVFYSMLFGHHPFVGRSSDELILRIKEGRAGMSAEVSEKTRLLLNRLFETAPERRLTAQELLNYYLTFNSCLSYCHHTHFIGVLLSLIHICRCRRYAVCRSRWSPDH
eukprot:TRINITY_DN12889_c0_g1_i6.p1 TRINITY_DN12889_c0_g1~~TRINITY_DN12889_c0_g1_i6.p1  ORF type:complete len:419 (-),score=70.39 TRINITY_DN12889_c0_g1_i6:12-1241(-)